MITGNINNLQQLLPDDILYCIDYAKHHDLENYPTGWYDTDKTHIKFRIDQYSTQIPNERFWESHKHHLDLYILLNGREEIHISPVAMMKPYHYIATTDLVMYEEAEAQTKHRLLNPGDYLICHQQEAHKTGVNVDLRNVFKIVLFKIHHM